MKRLNVLLLTLGIILVLGFVTISGIGCPFRFLTGIPCAGCGMTRAYWSLLSLDFKQAFYYHPLFGTIPLLLFLFILKETKRLKEGIFYAFLILIGILFFVVYILRLFYWDFPFLKMNLSNGLFSLYLRSHTHWLY